MSALLEQFKKSVTKELETWLKEEALESSGWSKDDGSGETVGHERYRSSLWLTSDENV